MKSEKLAQLDLEVRLEAARAEAKLLRADLHVVKRQLGAAVEIRDVLASAARAIRPPPAWRPAPGRAKPGVTALVLYGDLHVGEVTDPKQTEDWGRYNYAIAERRTRTYLDCLTRWLATQRAGYRIDDCALVLLGDVISGDIHEELAVTHEFPPPVQAIAAGRLISFLASGLAAQFRHVDIYAVSGSNHSRLTKKYQFKDGTLNSWDFVAAEYVRAVLAAHRNVNLRLLSARKEAVRIAGHWFLCSHGDNVAAWMGIPWYGIEREIGREARRRLERLLEQLRQEHKVSGMMDYGLGGHWHQPFVGPSFKYLINGSLSGTNEYDHARGRHAAPQQVAALISPQHGLFGPVAWRLDAAAERALKPQSENLWRESDG